MKLLASLASATLAFAFFGGIDAWVIVKPSSCSFEELDTDFPAAGEDCGAEYEPGDVAWSADKARNEDLQWMLYCSTDNVWTVQLGLKTLGTGLAEAKMAVRVDVDNSNNRDGVDGSEDQLPSWTMGTVTLMHRINSRLVNPAPSGASRGGSLFICLGSLDNGIDAALITPKGVEGDTPACADQPVFLNEAEFRASCPIGV